MSVASAEQFNIDGAPVALMVSCGLDSVSGYYTAEDPKRIPDGFAATCRKMRWNPAQTWDQLADSSLQWYEKANGAYIYFNIADLKWWIDEPSGSGVYTALTDGTPLPVPSHGYDALTLGEEPLPKVNSIFTTPDFEEDLKNILSKYAEVGEPLSPKDISECTKSLTDITWMRKGKQVNTIDVEWAVPWELRKLWLSAKELHLIKDHYNVFGANVYPPTDLAKTTLTVFGDQANRDTWLADQIKHQHDDSTPSSHFSSCAQDGWLCIGAFSEYDYIFCNLNSKSPDFGATRLMVNNTSEEKELTPAPFAHFVKYLTQVEAEEEEE